MRKSAVLAFLFCLAWQSLAAQSLRSFPLLNSRNPAAQAELPWLETGDSSRDERVNLRLWQQMLWGFESLENYWNDSSCQALLLDLHDTLHGLQDASARILWENDSLITFETQAEWLGAYLSHTLHRATVDRRSGRILYDSGADSAHRHQVMTGHYKAMQRYRRKALREHLRELKKLSGNDRELLSIVRSQCEEMPTQPEIWRDARGICVRLGCELPHAFAAWDKEITFVVPADALK